MTRTADERAGAPDGPRKAGRTGGRRAEILQRATECFDRLGYANTTLDDIARAVGIKREGIYYYFKNRGQICSKSSSRKAACWSTASRRSSRMRRSARARSSARPSASICSISIAIAWR